MAERQYIRAAFYQAAASSTPELDHTLFTHLIFVPSSPPRFVKSKLLLSGDDPHHLHTFIHLVTPTFTSLLALPYDLIGPHQPAALASSIDFAREHHSDGIHVILDVFDVDALHFCARWREAAAEEGRLTCRRPLLLTASFAQWSPLLTVPTGVPLPLDWLCLRGYHLGVESFYDVRSKGRLYGHIRSPLTFSHTAVHDSKPFDTLSIDVRLRACLDAGVDPSILVLGLAMHGFSFKLNDPSVHGMHAPVQSLINAKHGNHKSCQLDRHVSQKCTSKPLPSAKPSTWLANRSRFDIVAYKGVTRFIGERKAKCTHNNTTQSAYCHADTTWISYDDAFTITRKVGYLKSMRLKGYALDSLHEDTSDWHLSSAARSSLLADVESKQKMISTKGKGFKGKQKSKSRGRKEVTELGVHLAST